MADHVIQRFAIALETSDENWAKASKATLLKLLEGQLGSLLEELLDAYDRPNQQLVIEKLRIEIPRIDAQNWEKQLPPMLIQRLSKLLAQELGKQKPLSTEWLALRYFLERGLLPAWWEGSWELLLEGFAPQSLQAFWKYFEAQPEKAPAWRRWLWQWSDTQRWRFLQQRLRPSQLKALQATERSLASKSSAELALFWQAALAFAAQAPDERWPLFWQKKQAARRPAKAALPSYIAPEYAERYTERYTERELLLYYLERGSLPFWARLENLNELQTLLQQSFQGDARYWGNWLASQVGRKSQLWRLARTFPVSSFWKWLSSTHSPAALRFSKSLLKDLNELLPSLPVKGTTARMQAALRLELLQYGIERSGKRFYKKEALNRLLQRLFLERKGAAEDWKTAFQQPPMKFKKLSWWSLAQDFLEREVKTSSEPSLQELEQPSSLSKLDYLRFVLEQGSKPWWSADWAEQDLSILLSELIQQQPRQLLAALKRWQKQARMWTRLVQQLPKAQLSELLLLQLPEKGGAWLRLADLLAALESELPRLGAWLRNRGHWEVLLSSALGSSEQQNLEAQLEQLLLDIATQTNFSPLELLNSLLTVLEKERQPAFLIWKTLLPSLQQRSRLRNWKPVQAPAWQLLLEKLKAWGYRSEQLRRYLVAGKDQQALQAYLEKALQENPDVEGLAQSLRQQLQEQSKATLSRQSQAQRLEELQDKLLKAPSGEIELRILEAQLQSPTLLRDFLTQQSDNAKLRALLAEAEPLVLERLASLWDLPAASSWMALLRDAERLGWGRVGRQQFVELLQKRGSDFEPQDWLAQSLEALSAAQQRLILPLLLEWRSAWRSQKGSSLLPFYLLEAQISQLEKALAEQENPRMQAVLQERLASSRKEVEDLERSEAALRRLWKRAEQEVELPEKAAARLAEIGRVERAIAEQPAGTAAERAEQLLYLQSLYRSFSPRLRLALAKQRRLEARAQALEIRDLPALREALPPLPSLPQPVEDNWTKAAFLQRSLQGFFSGLLAWEQLLRQALSAYLQEEQPLTELKKQWPAFRRSLNALLDFLNANPEDWSAEELQLKGDLAKWKAQLDTLKGQLLLLERFERSLGTTTLRGLLRRLEKTFESLLVQRRVEKPLAEADAFALQQLQTWLGQQEQLQQQLEQLRDWQGLEAWAKRRNRLEAQQRAEDALPRAIEKRWQALTQAYEKRRAELQIALQKALATKKQALRQEAEEWNRRVSEWLEEGRERKKWVKKSKLREALAKTRQKEEEEVKVPISVSNAGLVLLWPFFSRFFKLLKLTNKKQFVDEQAQLKAIYLLQYVATRQTETPEYELALNKVLCGWPLSKPVPRSVPLTEEELETADSLLQGVLQNWSKMKTAGADGLRGGFIVRKGQLSESDERWRLVVERGGLDILLNTLPWGYNLVALPWMSKMLAVEW